MKRFRHNGKEYEIRLNETPAGWNAAVFCDGNRVSQDFAISRDTAHDIGVTTGRNGMEDHLQFVEDEFKNGRL